MADTIDTLLNDLNALRQVKVAGPVIGQRHLWVLSGGAPYFGRKNAFGADGKPSGVTADHGHPLRVLTIDMLGTKPEWRRPRLVGVHLVLGSVAKQYASRSGGLTVAFKAGASPVDARGGDVLRTEAEGAPEERDAPFVQVVGEPVAEQQWPPTGADMNTIPVPPLRLVAGRIGLRGALVDPKGKSTDLRWLETLGIRTSQEGKGKTARIWLVPDGIELDARLPFPGVNDPLEARVLLSGSADGTKFFLDLLQPANSNEAKKWFEAWGALVPVGQDEDALVGLKFAARRDRLPAFRWTIKLGKNVPGGVEDGVSIPEADLRIDLVSPPVRDTIDGVAPLRTGWVTATKNAKNQIELKFNNGEKVESSKALTFDCEPSRLDVAQQESASLVLDASLLASNLRAVYGIDAPPALPPSAAGPPAGPEFARPLISAFVPLDDGWLQLPIPNLGPLDATRDDNLVSVPEPPAKPSVFADGYFRAKRIGPTPGTLTAYPPPKPAPGPTPPPPVTAPPDAPWSITVKRATGLVGTITLIPRSGPSGGSEKKAATLDHAKIELSGFTFSTRGLIWVAADRPDALEALPRLGAGPGAFLDIALESGGDGGHLRVRLDKLSLVAERPAGPPQQIGPVALARVQLDLDFNTNAGRWRREILLPDDARDALGRAGQIVEGTSFPAPAEATDKEPAHARPWAPVVWQRHPYVPLAAGMPMTRAAAGVVRPLESRDLIPFYLVPGPYKKPPAPEKDKYGKPKPEKPFWIPLATLIRTSGVPFAQLPPTKRKRIAGWCWADGATAKTLPERGIAFAALGVPGIELRPTDAAAGSPGAMAYEAAVRYDVPPLDEAYATAPLPPIPPEQSATPGPSPAEREEEQPQPVATALDWNLLANFWSEQERKHQNSRVVDSYLAGFIPVGAETSVDVTTLIRGLVWKAEVKVTAAASEELFYGKVSIAGQESTGNEALLGLKDDFEPDLGDGTLKPQVHGKLKVLGFSPATFRVNADGFDLDNSLSGAKAAVRTGASLISRPVAFAKAAADSRLVSLIAPIDVSIDADLGGTRKTRAFRFWFKDVLFNGNAAVLGSDPIEFDIWDEAEKLVRSGFEWRFVPAGGPDADVGFRYGRDEVPLFGCRLEPLRLIALSVKDDAVASAQIECRLSLGPREAAPDPTANLVTMTLTVDASGACKAAFAMSGSDPSLHFRFALREDKEGAPGQVRQRRAVVEAKPTSGFGFGLDGRAFSLEVAGIPIKLGAPAITLDSVLNPDGTTRSDLVTITKTQPHRDPEPGHGRLTITSAEIVAGLILTKAKSAPDPKPATIDDHGPLLSLVQRIEIVPSEDGELTAPILSCTTPGTLALFGQTVADPPLEIQEGNGAVVVTARDGKLEPAGKAHWEVSLGLVARLRAIDGEAALDLSSGYCDASIVQHDTATAPLGFIDGAKVRDGRLRLVLSTVRREGTGPDIVWSGTATVSGEIEATNAINWPALQLGSDAIPVPGPDNHQQSGRVTIKLDTTDEAAKHTVTWIFSGHRLSAGRAAAIAAKPDAFWTTPVTARHVLSRGAKKLRWTSIDAVIVGAPRAIVPPFDGSDKAYNKDATTSAARYRDKIVGGNYGGRDKGMKRPGLGAVATVLQGALGAAFRQVFTPPPAGMLIAGGFLGVVRLAGEELAPLMRVPVLVGITDEIKQTGLGDGVELAWADGAAARLLAMTRAGAASPADTSLDALRAAMLAGSRRIPQLVPGERLDDPIAAILVEQSFVATDLATGASLQTTPFFLAAAVTVARRLKGLKNPGEFSAEALSLVAGSVKRGSKSVPLAAAITMRDAEPILPADDSEPQLIIVGDGLRVLYWNGPDPKNAESSLAPLVTGPAVARDPDPRAALIVWRNEDTNSRASYRPWFFPPAALDAVPPADMALARFQDHGRGHLSVAAGDVSLRWLAPAVEGAIRPIRDHKEDYDPSKAKYPFSGLAGLARRIALPAHAGPAAPVGAMNAAAPDLVWLSQTQVPVYLPLRIKDLSGPPIGWLTPAPSRVRLPTDDDVLQAIRATDQVGGSDEKVAREAQPFMPQAVDAASVGERAGVLTARRTRLLARLGDVPAFDPLTSRFGRPAQAGSSVARKIRTPRPGPLPANTSNSASDRRIQASAIRSKDAFQAVIGSADIVQGGAVVLPAWSITVVAAPEIASTVSDQWDGTVKLVCRVEAASTSKPAVKPLALLARALVREVKGDKRLETRALLKIGNVAIPFGRVVFDVKKLDIDWPAPAPEAPNLYRADVDIILDPRTATAPDPEPRAHPGVVAALAVTGALPSIEVQLTVHPSSGKRDSTIVAGDDRPLTIVDPRKPELSVGEERAPLTLRMPLYPVTAMRGALPLTPATLLFGDPAYDRDLAGPPTDDAQRLELAETEKKNLPAGRGDLRLVLAADRGRVNRRGVVTFMLDVRFARPMDEVGQARAEANDVAPGGDLMQQKVTEIASLRLELQPKDSATRALRLGTEPIKTAPGRVYELPLAALTEADGAPARLAPGDVLVMEAALTGNPTVSLWNSVTGGAMEIAIGRDNTPVARTLRLVLTDEAVVEPPPALYAALLRTKAGTKTAGGGNAWRIAVPLHAQSPLPWRVDLQTPARDFRTGIMHRRASFVWALVRPGEELAGNALHVVKFDRNGQTYLPDDLTEFIAAERTG